MPRKGKLCPRSCLSFNTRTLVTQKLFTIYFFNLPKKRYRIFKKNAETDELPDYSTDTFQRNMLDYYLITKVLNQVSNKSLINSALQICGHYTTLTQNLQSVKVVLK